MFGDLTAEWSVMNLKADRATWSHVYPRIGGQLVGLSAEREGTKRRFPRAFERLIARRGNLAHVTGKNVVHRLTIRDFDGCRAHPFPFLEGICHERPLIVDDAGCWEDRKSTRLNSSHQIISYAVF